MVVLDPGRVAAGAPQWAHDLPGGEPRFISRATGVAWSLVNGVPVLENGEAIEAPPEPRRGKLLRDFDA